MCTMVFDRARLLQFNLKRPFITPHTGVNKNNLCIQKGPFYRKDASFFQLRRNLIFYVFFSFWKRNAHYCEFFYHCASVPPPSKSD